MPETPAATPKALEDDASVQEGSLLTGVDAAVAEEGEERSSVSQVDQDQPTQVQVVRRRRAARLRRRLGLLRLRRHRRWLSWVGVGVIGLAAVGSGLVSDELRDHADERRQLIDELTQLEVLATGHSMTIWKALTLLMAEDKMGFIRMRGEAGKERQALGEQLEKVKALDESGAHINGVLGFEVDDDEARAVEDAAASFMGGVRGALGQMNLSAERVRKRMRYSDFGFGPFTEALELTKKRQEEIAVECAAVARQVTSLASFARLLASVMLALSLSRFRREVAAANASRS